MLINPLRLSNYAIAPMLPFKDLLEDATMFEVEDRRQASRATNAEGFVDRRKGPETRRKFQRWKTFKGAAIVGPSGAPIECIVRNLSDGGACLEVQVPIPLSAFDLILDAGGANHTCRVAWRQPPRMGVEFL
jgi:hypothetical protein